MREGRDNDDAPGFARERRRHHPLHAMPWSPPRLPLVLIIVYHCLLHCHAPILLARYAGNSPSTASTSLTHPIRVARARRVPTRSRCGWGICFGGGDMNCVWGGGYEKWVPNKERLKMIHRRAPSPPLPTTYIVSSPSPHRPSFSSPAAAPPNPPPPPAAFPTRPRPAHCRRPPPSSILLPR